MMSSRRQIHVNACGHDCGAPCGLVIARTPMGAPGAGAPSGALHAPVSFTGMLRNNPLLLPVILL